MDNRALQSKSILLLEDDRGFARPVIRWLRQEGFSVQLATSLGEAIGFLERQRIHLAIVDIRLDDRDESNIQGMEFLRNRDEAGLREVMPVIVLTGNATPDNILEAFNEYGVYKYLPKNPGYREKLLQAVHQAFEEKIQINFDLKYDENSDRILEEVVRDIYWSDRSVADLSLLVCETQDIFGRFFKDAENIYVSRLKPGLSGAGLVRVDPVWSGSGPGPARVIKIDRIDKSLTERNNYDRYVKNASPLATTQVSYECSQHLGGILYSFAEDASIEFSEFDEFYRKSDLRSIEKSLHGLVFTTCRFWYDHNTRKRANLQKLYFQAFNLETPRLIERIRALLPDYDPEQPKLVIPGDDVSLINPLHWLSTHEPQSTLAVKMCITHGDMTGRNIMVDSNGRCWMIDFLRTYQSHSLRDFVILETDLKYRQAPLMSDQQFLDLERLLILQGLHAKKSSLPIHKAQESKKLISVITVIRDLANQVAFGVANPSQMEYEYLLSLLMATLNVVRLRHIPPERKLQALRAANLICESLDG